MAEAVKELYEERRKWFTDRIGKKVYRNNTGCPCKSCQDVYVSGLRIGDLDHAKYLMDVEGDFTACGHPTKYFDTVKERDEFETQLKNKKA